MADTAKKWAWLSVGLWVVTALVVWRVETTRASRAATQAPPVDGGPVQVDIDASTCKVTPEDVAIDLELRPQPGRPNHYQVRWKVAVAGRPDAARVRIVHDPTKSTGPAAFAESYEINPSGGEVLSGKPTLIRQESSLWAYTVEVLGRDGEPLCPPVDPGLCFPGMGGDCSGYKP